MTRTRSRLRGGSCSRRMKKADSPARARSVETATGLHPDVGHVCEKKQKGREKKSCTILSGPATANLLFYCFVFVKYKLWMLSCMSHGYGVGVAYVICCGGTLGAFFYLLDRSQSVTGI